MALSPKEKQEMLETGKNSRKTKHFLACNKASVCYSSVATALHYLDL